MSYTINLDSCTMANVYADENDTKIMYVECRTAMTSITLIVSAEYQNQTDLINNCLKLKSNYDEIVTEYKDNYQKMLEQVGLLCNRIFELASNSKFKNIFCRL